MRISDWSSDVCDCERFGHSRHQAGRDRPPAGRPTDRLETLGFRDFPPVVVTAGRADMMRALQLTAARAFVIAARRSEEHTSELQSLMRISYAGFCLKKKTRILIKRKQKT